MTNAHWIDIWRDDCALTRAPSFAITRTTTVSPGREMERSKHDEIVELIYDSALNPDNWPNAIALIRDELDSTAAGFFSENSKHELLGTFLVGVDSKQVEIYGEHYASINPWFTTPGLMKPGRILSDLSLEVLHNNRKAFTNTSFYQEWFTEQDFRHAMGGVLIDNQGDLLNFTFWRPPQAGYYTQADIERYRPICKHLMRAMRMSAQLEQTQLHMSVAQHALDKLRLGVILLDSGARVAFINSYARALLNADTTFAIQQSRLTSAYQQNRAALGKCMDDVYRERKTSNCKLFRLSGGPLSMCAIPASERRQFVGLPTLCAAIFISDPDDREIGDADYLAKRWQLAPLEAQFCLQLLRGNTIANIGSMLQLTRTTAQWYTKQIMQKVGAKRQAELISVLMNDLAGFLRPTHR